MLMGMKLNGLGIGEPGESILNISHSTCLGIGSVGSQVLLAECYLTQEFYHFVAKSCKLHLNALAFYTLP